MAAQLTSTNLPIFRLPEKWRARATSSLPVPLSPVTTTEASAFFSRAIMLRTCRMAALLPWRPSSSYLALSSSVRLAIVLFSSW